MRAVSLATDHSVPAAFFHAMMHGNLFRLIRVKKRGLSERVLSTLRHAIAQSSSRYGIVRWRLIAERKSQFAPLACWRGLGAGRS